LNIRAKQIENWFPMLRVSGYRITSPRDGKYNCIAWAADRDDIWMDPAGYYWPPDVPRENTLDILVRAFGTLGYSPCKSEKLERGFQKVAIYVATDGVPSHAARQLPTGKWTSKLADWEDIEHKTLAGLTNSFYGNVAKILCKPEKDISPIRNIVHRIIDFLPF
jgi:hypothetical protein